MLDTHEIYILLLNINFKTVSIGTPSQENGALNNIWKYVEQIANTMFNIYTHLDTHTQTHTHTQIHKFLVRIMFFS